MNQLGEVAKMGNKKGKNIIRLELYLAKTFVLLDISYCTISLSNQRKNKYTHMIRTAKFNFVEVKLTKNIYHTQRSREKKLKNRQLNC